MVPKGDTTKKNTKNKPAPKANLHLIDEESRDSSRDLIEYPMKKKVDPRERLSRKKNWSR